MSTQSPALASDVKDALRALQALQPKVGSDMLVHIAAGDSGHQGDVYVHPIKEKPAAWDVLVQEHTQVALGQGTGSRHIAEGDVKVYWPKSKASAREQLPLKGYFKNRKTPISDAEMETTIGPVVVAEKGFTLTHPEHGHHVYPAGTYLVTYQFDERTRREVRD